MVPALNSCSRNLSNKIAEYSGAPDITADIVAIGIVSSHPKATFSSLEQIKDGTDIKYFPCFNDESIVTGSLIINSKILRILSSVEDRIELLVSEARQKRLIYFRTVIY
jgi:hypothetical protein